MTQTAIGAVVERSRDDLVFMTEVQASRTFVVADRTTEVYRNGDILTLNLTTKTFVDAVENYPFI